MAIMHQQGIRLRQLDNTDFAAMQRILETSDNTYYHFGPEELPHLLRHLPAVGAFSEKPRRRLRQALAGSLQAFLLVNWLVPPSAWLGGFGATWSESRHYEDYLDLLLPAVEQLAASAGAHTLYYSGGELETDWLRKSLERRGFSLHSLLRSYDKGDFTLPSTGNMQVQVRPFTAQDADGVVAVENLTFDQLWRHDSASFLEVSRTYPYFVVAEDEQGIVGYQYNTVDAGTGYLVRIAVHPRAQGEGVGIRLMAEAVHYFQAHNVWKIALNTEENNTHAQALYEWFGFRLVYPRGFVLQRPITVAR